MDDRHRVVLEFSPNAFDELESLRKRLKASSNAEVIRDALGVLKWALGHIENHHRILVETDRDRIEFDFRFLRERDSRNAK